MILLAALAASADAVSLALPPLEALPDSALSRAERTQLAAIEQPEQQLSFRITRAYLRICRAVTPANAARLPLKPRRFNPAFLNVQEKAVVDGAIRMSVIAMLRGAAGGPAPG